MHTPGSMNSLFGDLFGKSWRGFLGGGARDSLGKNVGCDFDSVLVGFNGHSVTILGVNETT